MGGREQSEIHPKAAFIFERETGTEKGAAASGGNKKNKIIPLQANSSGDELNEKEQKGTAATEKKSEVDARAKASQGTSVHNQAKEQKIEKDASTSDQQSSSIEKRSKGERRRSRTSKH